MVLLAAKCYNCKTCDWATNAAATTHAVWCWKVIYLNTFKIYLCKNHLDGEEWWCHFYTTECFYSHYGYHIKCSIGIKLRVLVLVLVSCFSLALNTSNDCCCLRWLTALTPFLLKGIPLFQDITELIVWLTLVWNDSGSIMRQISRITVRSQGETE